jgi:phosphotransferase system HPr-like phosphotransfer protein
MLMKLAAHFVRAKDGESVEFTVGDHTVNPGNGILAMLGLLARKGGTLTVTVRGAETERAQGLLDAVQAVVGHPFPEDAVYQPDAAQEIGLKPELVEILRLSINNLRPE